MINSHHGTRKMKLNKRFISTLIDNYDEVDAVLVQSLDFAERHRYHKKRSKYRKARMFLFEADLKEEGEDDEEVPWLKDRKFLQKHRMSRTSFHAIYDLIKDHSVFAERTNNCRGQEASVKYQFMVLLKYLGTEGSGSSNLNLRSVFGIGEGTT